MSLTLLFPRFVHPAIEERYAVWQNRLLITRAVPTAPVLDYDLSSRAADILTGVGSTHVLVVTNPLFVAGSSLVSLLTEALARHPQAAASLPSANESPRAEQLRAPAVPYLTLRQFEDESARAADLETDDQLAEWDGSDPAVYLCRTEELSESHESLARALAGRSVVVERRAYIHRYSSHRGQVRTDLLERISGDARTILEFGCGEGALGSALKARQECRVVGVELNEEAAGIARTKLDSVHSGDVRDLMARLDETFDWIVGGDILEHLEEPWSFLQDLRRVANPGAHLLLSLPNISSWPIVSDLLRGRFDYVYMGILCAGHVRFFTRRMIEEMLEIAGWRVVSIEAQETFSTPEGVRWQKKLAHAGIEHSPEDLATPGFYVTARYDVTGL
ncbi:MAG TPA: class I SAM-dependent methyltransferase [Thermoanaerobaculia bacterium]|nr:class I SAM-dependent methyltransferase [Thermoanaerobaculia bacterium]